MHICWHLHWRLLLVWDPSSKIACSGQISLFAFVGRCLQRAVSHGGDAGEDVTRGSARAPTPRGAVLTIQLNVGPGNNNYAPKTIAPTPPQQ